MILGKGAQENATGRSVPNLLQTGRKFTSLVQVRRDGLKAYIDGQLMAEWKTDSSDLGIYDSWKLRNGSLIGLGAIESRFVFHRAQLLEVTGKGSPWRPAALASDPWKGAVPLLPLVDPARDAVEGEWKREGSELTCAVAKPARIEIPYQLPDEYDVRLQMTQKAGTGGLAVVLARAGRTFLWIQGGFGNTYAGFEVIRDAGVDKNPTTLPFKMEYGRRYTTVLQVRKDGIAALVDGKEVARWKTDYSDLKLPPQWKLRDGSLLGIASYESPAVFHSLELLEIRGTGRPTRKAPASEESWIAEVRALPPDEQVGRVVARLQELNQKWNGKAKHEKDGPIVASMSFSSAGITDLAPLRALKDLRKLDCRGTWSEATGEFELRLLADLSPLRDLKLKELGCGGTKVSDLNPLKGMPLEELDLGGSEVSDLTPLKDLPLNTLTVTGTKVTSLAPLGGKRLAILACEWTDVADLGPVQGSEIEYLHFRSTKVTNLAPLSTLRKLKNVRLDVKSPKDLEILKSIRTLETINDVPAAEFLKGSGGLVGHWRFDEGKGETAADSSGRGHSARLVGGPTWTRGVLAGGLQFNGGDCYVELPRSAVLDGLQKESHTVCAWVKPDLLPKDVRPNQGFGIVLKEGFNDGLVYGGEGQWIMEYWLQGNVPGMAISETFAPGRFYHVAGVVDRAGTTGVFVDGVLKRSVSWNPKSPTRDYGTTPWRLGIMSPGHERMRFAFKGILDDVRLYNRALSAAEIDALFKEKR
jgi:concanavalin A-like lectin/glucanase superfamily protein